ncbi:serine/threonine-protein kinase mos isoform X2 [Zootermopsis nevadensis]|uniref:serine/threonine-protein kinase mos isoform X2 n=1 Tax=Zootermopsis nevadensis TaxID=136037 RepID=UPI000B8E4DBF|nr:serine/threonine-protein kinase mos isoform X2 [Zootermopsis nevadensis]
MASSLRHLQKLASPKNVSPLCISRNEAKSPHSSKKYYSSLYTPVTDSLSVTKASHNATKSSNMGMCLSPSRNCAAQKLEWSSEFASSPRSCSKTLSFGTNERTVGGVDALVTLDTQKIIALLSHGLNSKKHWIRLGKGSFGTVIQAKYKGEDVAVKVIPKSRFQKSIGSLRNESNALKLSHKNVVKVLHVIPTGGEYGLVFMELCNGQNLQSVISDPTFVMNSTRRTRYALDIALALHHCHGNKILHLDVKPSNIMVCSQADYCKLCDFGSSHVLGDEGYCTVSPNMNTVMYTDPDILQGKLPSEKSDVYSLGITCWQLLSHEVPYQGYTLHEIIYKALAGSDQSQYKMLNYKISLVCTVFAGTRILLADHLSALLSMNLRK